MSDEGALQVHPGLEMMKDDPLFAVYEVKHIDDDRTAPDTTSVDGYICRTEELTL
jgi:hypothetical protein